MGGRLGASLVKHAVKRERWLSLWSKNGMRVRCCEYLFAMLEYMTEQTCKYVSAVYLR